MTKLPLCDWGETFRIEYTYSHYSIMICMIIYIAKFLTFLKWYSKYCIHRLAAFYCPNLKGQLYFKGHKPYIATC